MSIKDKLIERFCRIPKDFSFDEVVHLFSTLGYHVDSRGRTSGSRVAFINGDRTYIMHKPHPDTALKRYALRALYRYLKDEHLI